METVCPYFLGVKLGARYQCVQTGSKRRLAEVQDTFQYVPFLEGLQALLCHADIRDEVRNINFDYRSCLMYIFHFRCCDHIIDLMA